MTRIVAGLFEDQVAAEQAIERLGARKDGIIRHHSMRKDGSPRDSVMYSILACEWPEVRRNLDARLARGERLPITRT